MENNLMLNEITTEIMVLENQLTQFKEIEKKQKELKNKLKTAMENAGVTKWETTNGIKITLVSDTPDEMVTKSFFNEAKFQEENKELVKQYIEIKEKYKETKEELVKGKMGYVRITLPKDNKVYKDTEEIPF